MLSPVRPSVRLFITRVDQSKMVEVSIMQLSPQSSPMILVSSWLTSPQSSKGNMRLWRQMIEGIKNVQLSANKSPPYLRNGAIYDQGSYDGLIGRRIRAFDWYQNHRPWMNLNIRYALYSCKNLNEDRPILSAAKM